MAQLRRSEREVLRGQVGTAAVPDRHGRQRLFRGIGPSGQERIARGRVLIVGLGALGSHCAETLLRAGVGSLWLVDRDVVELHNLQRQSLYDTRDAERGTPKAQAAAEHLARIDAAPTIHPVVEHFDADTWDALPERPSVVVDGTDNFATRYLINDLCARDRVPWVHGAAIGGRGQAMVVRPGESPCLRCLLPDPPTGLGSCETEGVLAPTVIHIAAFQATQTLRLLTGQESECPRGVFTVDVWEHRFRQQLGDLPVSAHCPACSGTDYPALHEDPDQLTVLCGRDAVQVRPSARFDLDLRALATRLEPIAEDVELRRDLLRFAVDGCRVSVFPGGRALLFGSSDPNRARSLYDRYVAAGR